MNYQKGKQSRHPREGNASCSLKVEESEIEASKSMERITVTVALEGGW